MTPSSPCRAVRDLLQTMGQRRSLARPPSAITTQCPYGTRTTILDADQDVVESVTAAIGNVRQDGWSVSTYDAADDPPAELQAQHSVVFLDPPWYSGLTRLFLSHALTPWSVIQDIYCVSFHRCLPDLEWLENEIVCSQIFCPRSMKSLLSSLTPSVTKSLPSSWQRTGIIPLFTGRSSPQSGLIGTARDSHLRPNYPWLA